MTRRQETGGAQPDRKKPHKGEQNSFSEHDVEDIEDRSRLRVPLIYEVVRREGEEEMRRPAISLIWSGIAAGLSISFSLVAQAAFTLHLPDEPWRPLLASLGYPVGFLIVVLGRQQLFTENTITAVLPFVAEPTLANFRRLVRLWTIVLLANMAGTLVAALFLTFTPTLAPDLGAVMLEISRQAMAGSWGVMFFKGIAAGFLIAAMVWLIPNAEAGQFQVVVVMTYLISLGGFAHIVAGSVEAFVLMAQGEIGLASLLGAFMLPVLLGNIVGGTVLFALICYAQVAKEV
jgi:formate/nitrite transporter FocA (FNT family)